MNEMTIHAFCAIFPEASPEEFQQLRASIDKRGQIDPIVLLGNEILDGRTRYKVCRELKIPPQFRQYNAVKDGADPLQWVIDKNLNRRHLTVGQRSALAVELTKLAKAAAEAKAEEAKPNPSPTPNGPADDPDDLPDFLSKPGTGENAGTGELTQEQAADAMGVSPRSVGDAAYLAKNDPERFDAVKSGKTSLHAATEAAKKEADDDQGLLGKTTTIQNQYRTECADMIAASQGDKFAEAVRNDTILRDQELRAFMKLTVQDQKQIAALVVRGWKVREAVKFAKGIFEKDDPIRDLLNLAIMRDGKAVAKLDGHTILIIADPLLEQSSYAADIAAIVLAQSKPETTTPKVDNSLGKAMEAAKGKKSDAPASKGSAGSSPVATATAPQSGADSTNQADKPGKPKAGGKPSATTTESTAPGDAPNAGSTKDAPTTGKPGKPAGSAKSSPPAPSSPASKGETPADAGKPAKKLTKAEQKAAEIERQGKRELFLVSVEKAPKKNRVKMILDYWRDNGDEAATYLMAYPTLTHTPDPLIVATLDEIGASIKVKEVNAR